MKKVVQRKEVSILEAIDRIKKAIGEFYRLKKDMLGVRRRKRKDAKR